jgi:hypothetical protein
MRCLGPICARIPGILFVWAPECDSCLGIKKTFNGLRPNPYASEQGIYFALAGN